MYEFNILRLLGQFMIGTYDKNVHIFESGVILQVIIFPLIICKLVTINWSYKLHVVLTY